MPTISPLPSYDSFLYGLANAGNTAVAQTTQSGLVQTAIDLASAGGMIATLGGSAYAPLTYNAAGLLNTFAQAGTVSSGGSSGTSAQNSTDMAIVDMLPANSVAAGVYNSSGTLQGLPSDTTTNWANALKASPALASTVISDSFDQGIAGTLSITA